MRGLECLELGGRRHTGIIVSRPSLSAEKLSPRETVVYPKPQNQPKSWDLEFKNNCVGEGSTLNA